MPRKSEPKAEEVKVDEISEEEAIDTETPGDAPEEEVSEEHVPVGAEDSTEDVGEELLEAYELGDELVEEHELADFWLDVISHAPGFSPEFKELPEFVKWYDKHVLVARLLKGGEDE